MLLSLRHFQIQTPSVFCDHRQRKRAHDGVGLGFLGNEGLSVLWLKESLRPLKIILLKKKAGPRPQHLGSDSRVTS